MIDKKLIKYLNKFIICTLHSKYSYLVYIYKIDKEFVYYFLNFQILLNYISNFILIKYF